MSDLIDRQAAIDALHMHLMYRMGTDSNKKRLDDWINGVPPAQPDQIADVSKKAERTAETAQNVLNSELISKKAAIDAINTWDKFGVDERGRLVRWHEGLELYVHLRDVLTAIVNLPSAQPENVKCKKCRYVYYDKEFGNYWCNRKPDSFMVEEDGYCKWGK